MCVCSGTHSDSKLRASASRASSSMRIAYSVAKMQTPIFMRNPPGSAGRGGARRGRQREVRVGREPAAVAPLEGERAPTRAGKRAAVGEDATRVPGGGDPAAIGADGAARPRDVDREIADDRPDATPLLALDDVEALHERRDGPEGDDVGRTEIAAAREIDRAHARLPRAQPFAERCEVVGQTHGKIASGMKADTIQFGASTISLILRSAATEQMTYASSRVKPRVSTRWSIM